MTGQIVVGAPDLDASLVFFTGVGFRVDQIFPADDPSTAIISGHDLVLRLERGQEGPSPHLRLRSMDQSGETVGPNGTRIVWVNESELDEDTPPALPDLVSAFSLVRLGAEEGSGWNTGRAGMHYRDLIPDRLGGRFIASHIRIVDGGPVPDYVHHHHIRFQMIFCYRGWVDVVYEDQGPAFRMEAGDCVLQPPHIRHRVLASSPGCEVIEIGCPAEHETLADHRLELPTLEHAPGRDFGGQRFVRSEAATTEMIADGPWLVSDSGIGAATNGLAGSRVRRWTRTGKRMSTSPRLADSEFFFVFVLEGTLQLIIDGAENGRAAEHDLASGDAFSMPAGTRWHFAGVSEDCELLEVTLPG